VSFPARSSGGSQSGGLAVSAHQFLGIAGSEGKEGKGKMNKNQRSKPHREKKLGNIYLFPFSFSFSFFPLFPLAVKF
jgi:hypothetical protein